MRANRIAYMKILQASIPFSYYTVNTDNNTCTLLDTSISTNFQLAPGTYTPAALITELTDKLNGSGTTYTYTVTYNASNLAFAITNGSVLSNPFSITFATAGIRKDTLGSVLGFPTGSQTSQTHQAAVAPIGNRLQGGVSELAGANFLYINSNSVGNEVNLFLPRGSNGFGNGGPQMAMMPTTDQGVFGDNMHYEDPCHDLWFDMGGIESLTKLDLFVSDGGSQEITRFNGRSFSVKIGMLLADGSLQHAGHITANNVTVTGKRPRVQ